MSGKRFLILAGMVLALTRPVMAGERGSRFWVFLESGPTVKLAPERFKEFYGDKDNRHTGVGLMYRFLPKLALRSEFFKGYFSGIAPDLDIPMANHRNEMELFTWTNELVVSFFRGPVRPYVSLGGGIAFVSYVYRGWSWPYTKFLLTGSAGIDFQVAKRLRLFAEARYDSLFHKYFENKNAAIAPISFGISYNL
jgi:hypothetical protein